jgi:hypothetical protein
MPGWVGTAHRTESGEFKCRRCGWSGRAEVTAVGTGRATLFFDKPQDALVEARQDASHQAARTIQRARCKKCGQRNPGELLRYWLSFALACAAAAALVVYEIVMTMKILELGGGWHLSFEQLAVLAIVLGLAWHGRRKRQNIDGGIVWLE